MAREKNPVSLMDSVDAMDLLGYSYRRLRDVGDDPKQLARIKEQKAKHEWALRKHIDGSFEREDEPESKKKLTREK